MSSGILACGTYFSEDGLIASVVLLLLVKPLAYFGYVEAFRFRVSRAIPMTTGQAAKLAGVRALLGVLFIGGGALVVGQFGRSDVSILLASWVYMFLARVSAWWFVGSKLAQLRGHRLVGWIIGGTALNAGIDLAVVGGLAGGWVFPVGAAVGIGVFVWVLRATGRRDSLLGRFADWPTCSSCGYNLTGNLSGICPECGTGVKGARSAVSGV